MITATVEFDGLTLEAEFQADSMADAIGCPAEHAGQFAGQICLELHSCINADTGAEHKPTPEQFEALQDEALKNIARPREIEPARGWWED